MVEWIKHIIPAFAINSLLREQLTTEKAKSSDLSILVRDQLSTIKDQASKIQILELKVTESENEIKKLNEALNNCNTKLNEATHYEPSDLEPKPTVD